MKYIYIILSLSLIISCKKEKKNTEAPFKVEFR